LTERAWRTPAGRAEVVRLPICPSERQKRDLFRRHQTISLPSSGDHPAGQGQISIPRAPPRMIGRSQEPIALQLIASPASRHAVPSLVGQSIGREQGTRDNMIERGFLRGCQWCPAVSTAVPMSAKDLRPCAVWTDCRPQPEPTRCTELVRHQH